MTIKGFALPKRPINKHGNSAAIRERVPRLHRTIRDAQNITRRHFDDPAIQQAATELIELCRTAVKDETK